MPTSSSGAEAFVFVYPTWWSTMPAILKGWLERVMVPGVGFVFDDHHHVRRGLKRVRRVVGISTYGARRIYVKAIHDNGRRILLRALRMNTAVLTRRSWLGLYEINTADRRAAGCLPAASRPQDAFAVKTYVVYCHPTPESLTSAVRDRAVAALLADGHQVRVV